MSLFRVSRNGKSCVEHRIGGIVATGGGGIPLFAVAPSIEEEALEPLAATIEARVP